jgi:hypothetical protein
MTGADLCVNKPHKSVPVIIEPPCINDTTHVFINKQLESFQSCFGVYLVLCQEKGSNIFVYFNVSAGKASLRRQQHAARESQVYRASSGVIN